MKAIIVDDEILARERIADLLNQIIDIEILKQCSNGKSAVSAINDMKPDLLFLDIDMKDMSGFQVLEQIEIDPKPIIIFITAHDQYALKAFEFEALDFLLKPFKEERFLKTVRKAIGSNTKDSEKDFDQKLKLLLDLYHQQNNKDSVNKIPVKQGNRTILIDIPEIKYIVASGYYAEIFVNENKYLLRETLSSLIATLDEKMFARIHRSAIVNINYIKEVVHSDFGEADVKMKDDRLLKISRPQKREFFAKVGILNEK